MKNKVGTICVAVGALLVALGVFLPFYIKGEEGINLFNIIHAIWPIAGVAAVLFSIIGNKLVTLICSLISGVGALLAFFLNSVDSSLLADNVRKGLGYWCTLIGGIVMLLAGVVYYITTKTPSKEDE